MSKKHQVELIPEGELQICQFSGKTIRKVLHKDEWFFSIVDVVAAMTDSNRPAKYWSDLKVKMSENEGFKQLSDKIGQLKMPGPDGKMYETDCGNTETVFRVIQSIPSPQAEPFKQWLAKVGYERIQEIQNPAIAIKRAIVEYQMLGRSMDWIDARLRTIVSRKELTDHWQLTGITDTWEFAVLTDEISKGTFSKTTAEYKEYKGLKKYHNLRDNMTQIELILTMLGETATKQIAKSRGAKGFCENQVAAKAGGQIAGGTRHKLEQATGHSVVSKENNLKCIPTSPDLLRLPESFEESVQRFKGASEN